MTTEDLKKRIEAGDTICNIGHWTKSASAWVRRAYAAGKLQRVSSGYPDGRWAYRAA